MVEVVNSPHLYNNKTGEFRSADSSVKEEQKKGTMAYSILDAHNQSGNSENLNIKFDALASHDITYVGIIQTARASGLTRFPVPYVLTNCHNSLCAVGGTINEDDHRFGRSAAEKYGGIFVPAHQAVIHMYMREMMAGCGKMILGSDSHTRYGALGTMAIGEGGPELVKQLLSKTYDIAYPEVAAVYLEGEVNPGVGPQDVALALIKEVFPKGLVKNKVLEFIGPGIANLSVDYRNGIDVMTTETTCLTSIWETDEKVKDFLSLHGREEEYSQLAPGQDAYYDTVIKIDLSKIKPMIALPFHPSNVFTIEELQKNGKEILGKIDADYEKETGQKLGLADKVTPDGILVDQAVIAGCSGGTYENIMAAGQLLNGGDIGQSDFTFSVYPSSQPVYEHLVSNGTISEFMKTGAIVRSAFCGPCFGAGDTPFNSGFSVRHTTRNFPSREGSKPKDGQIASVALMDARSIAATAMNKGILTAADQVPGNDKKEGPFPYTFDASIYQKRCYNGFNQPKADFPLAYGPNIVDWPKMSALPENLLLKVTAYIPDDVTTTDELIPSGETSSYRSNPKRLAEFTLSRRVPSYVEDSKAVQALDDALQSGSVPAEIADVVSGLGAEAANTQIGSVVYAHKPGDGSAREQAASCQKVLGGRANIAREYATKRYRSNCINWGMVPFEISEADSEKFGADAWIYLKGIRAAVESGTSIKAGVLTAEGKTEEITLDLSSLSSGEREILLDGCLINHYSKSL